MAWVGDRLGVRWGLAGGIALSSIEEVREVARYAQDMEGLDEPADLHLIGTWERIVDGLESYAEAGVTDFRLEIAAHNTDARDATRAALARHLTVSS